ncbi:hypothetical protein CsSME_00000499 [Camellia sinensis var. sinensis]
MKTLFKSYDLWDLVENGFVDLADPEQATRLTAAQRNELKEKKQKDAKALFLIQQALDEAVFPRVMDVSTSKEAWDLLQEEYQGSSRVVTLKLQTPRREFKNLSMKSSEATQEFFSKVTSIVNQIRSLGEELTNQKLLRRFCEAFLPNLIMLSQR